MGHRGMYLTQTFCNDNNCTKNKNESQGPILRYWKHIIIKSVCFVSTCVHYNESDLYLNSTLLSNLYDLWAHVVHCNESDLYLNSTLSYNQICMLCEHTLCIIMRVTCTSTGEWPRRGEPAAWTGKAAAMTTAWCLGACGTEWSAFAPPSPHELSSHAPLVSHPNLHLLPCANQNSQRRLYNMQRN